MEAILDALEGTPWWVYLIFCYLVLRSVKAAQPQTLPVFRIVILPIVLTIWSLAGLFSKWDWSAFLSWAIALIPGFILGWLSVRSWKIRFDRKRKTLSLPGSWSTLGLLMIIFAVKYFFGYYAGTHSTIPLTILLAQMGASGIITGMFFGRMAYFWKRYEEV